MLDAVTFLRGSIRKTYGYHASCRRLPARSYKLYWAHRGKIAAGADESPHRCHNSRAVTFVPNLVAGMKRCKTLGPFLKDSLVLNAVELGFTIHLSGCQQLSRQSDEVKFEAILRRAERSCRTDLAKMARQAPHGAMSSLFSPGAVRTEMPDRGGIPMMEFRRWRSVQI
nr:hypothetical protein Iba_chr04dCG15480 [Ipomoea batatas]